MNRGWAVTLAALAVLLTAALGVVTNLATTSIPTSFRWSHDKVFLWSGLGVIVIAASSIAALQVRSPSRGGKGTKPAVDEAQINYQRRPFSTNFVKPKKAATAGNLPTRNQAFTDREKILEQVGLTLGSGRTTVVVLHGLGGVGKSQIALEYAHRMREESHYELIWWIRADSDITAREDLAHLAGLLDVSAGGKTGDISYTVVSSLSSGQIGF